MNRLKFHYEEVDKIDAELGEMCKAKIEPLISEGKIQEAKNVVIEFFDGFSLYSLYRDILIANLNRKLLNIDKH